MRQDQPAAALHGRQLPGKPHQYYRVRLYRPCDGSTTAWPFVDTRAPSICVFRIDFKMRTIEMGDKRAKLQIWDTAGQERFRTITQAYYRGAMGIVIVYDVTDRSSFENVKNDWVKNVNRHVNTGVRKVLVANKIDLEQRRMVTTEEGQQLADELGIRFFETSALSGANVESMFVSLAKEIRETEGDRSTKSVPSTDRVMVQAVSSSPDALSRCC